MSGEICVGCGKPIHGAVAYAQRQIEQPAFGDNGLYDLADAFHSDCRDARVRHRDWRACDRDGQPG